MFKHTVLSMLISIFIFSCAPQKYGRHFNNTSQRNSIQSEAQYQEKLKLTLDSLIIELAKADTVISQSALEIVKKDTIDNRSEFSDSDRVFIDPLIKNDTSIAMTPKELRKSREQDPVGLLGFFLSLIGAITFASGVGSENFNVGFIGFWMAIVGASLGLFSLKRTGIKKGKWKGRGFGLFSLGVMALILIVGLIGLIYLFYLAFEEMAENG